MLSDDEVARFRQAFQRQREEYPSEDPEVSFRMACREMNIVSKSKRQEMLVIVGERGRLALIGRWQAARHRPHWTDERETLNEELHPPKPGAA